VVAAISFAFLLLFQETIKDLLVDWANDPDYGHGLLLLPIAIYLAWRSRLLGDWTPSRIAGSVILAAAVALFWLGTIAAEFFTRRFAVLLALFGLVVYYRGWHQARAWWLPFGLLLVTIPIPEVVLNTITLPLQLLASRVAVGLLQFRHVPAELAGNIILLPGTELFVAEACSGLRSLSALVGMSLLMGGTLLTTVRGRAILLLLAVPAALAANALRVFLTGYLVYYVGPQAAEGMLHQSAGIGVFLLALGFVAAGMSLLRRLEVRSR
jgi:exosortase